jgi:hypothetical protein
VIFRPTPDGSLTFKCTDDVETIPLGTDVLVVGGGDIINDYFMNKIRDILDASPWFEGEVYAISVGIPYESCAAKWLPLFDHVFLRNSADYALAKSVIGEHNVTQMCDACAYIPMAPVGASSTNAKRVGISVSRPFFLAHPEAIQEVARAISRLNREGSFEIHLVAFNHHEANPDECDHISCDDLYDALLSRRVYNVSFHDDDSQRTPARSIDLVRSMDVMVCMRYHAAVFALTNPGGKTVVLNCSSKLAKLASDYGVSVVDAKSSRLSSRLFHAVRTVLSDNAAQRCIDAPLETTSAIRNIIYGTDGVRKKRADLLKLADLSHLEAGFERRMLKLGALRANVTREDEALREARLVSLALTDSASHSCVWGLAENMLKPDFDLDTSARYIWGDRVVKAKAIAAIAASREEEYLPGGGWGLPTQRTLVDLRCHSLLAGSYHRSGWAYVESGLQNLSAQRFGRQTPRFVLDTYADETFLWASDANVRTGVIPYRTAWVAFVHHTFDSACYPHDLKTMFDAPAFLDSLPTCVCLITLSRALAVQTRAALDAIEGGVGKHVRVETLVHPTELGLIPTFSIDTFLKSEKRRLLQVGAWLRDEATFRSFSLGDNPLGLAKTILRTYAVDKNKKGPQSASGFSASGFPASGFASGFSASGFASGIASGIASGNVVVEIDDVEELSYLGATEYDALLSSSVVFLCLYDASAVNTVIECIVRKTPILVNRLPAVEEALGEDYPGFYVKGGDPVEIDESLIRRCHDHLCNIDMTPYRIETFLKSLDELTISFKK